MQNKIKENHKPIIYFSVFFITLSLFIYEVLLTRLFSVILSYNMVFLVVSFSILGSGLGGIYIYSKFSSGKKKGNKNNDYKYLKKKFIVLSSLLPVGIMTAIGIMYKLPYMEVSMIYVLIGMVPFILGGAILSFLFKEFKENSNKLYFMDLIGAALGSIVVLKIMNAYGFMYSVATTIIISLTGVIFIGIYFRSKKSLLINCSIFIFLSFLLVQGNYIEKIEKSFTSYYSSPNTVIDYLRNSNEKNLGISYTRWNSVSRTDVIETNDKNKKIIVTDGGASAPIIKFNGDLGEVEYLKKEINYLPFSVGKNEDALVIGSGGGKDVLFALLSGSENISAVEINSSTIEAVNNFKDFSGDIYGRPEVTVYNEDGRSFIEKTEDKYDNIYLSMVMTNSIENTMYSLSENYLYTYEAFEKYFNQLNDNGKLSFMMHDIEDMSRIVNTGIKVLLDKGIPQEEITDYFVIVNGTSEEYRRAHGNMVMMPLIMFKKQAFAEDEIKTIKDIVIGSQRQFIHFPGGENELYRKLKDNEITYKEMLGEYPFNVKPITDNSPFYYNYSSFVPIEILLIFIGLIIIWFTIRTKYFKDKEIRTVSRHFIVIGMAYMLIEIPIIQKLSLYLGNPSLAFSIVLFSILLSSGIGSILSGSKFVKKYTMKSSVYLAAVAASVITVLSAIDKVIMLTSDFGVNEKFIVVFLTLLPMGALMGMPFPIGISKIKDIKGSKDIIPLMWAANGMFSVIGSVLAVSLSMKVGFNITIIIGGLFYLYLYINNPFKNYEGA